MASNGKPANGNAQPTTPRQPSKPDLKFREPFTWDLTYAFLCRTAFHPLALLVYPALVYLLDKRSSGAPSVYPAPSFTLLRELLSPSSTNQYKWIARVFWFSLVKNINNALTRYARNHGQWRRDRPDWKKDVVVITGGAAGIGKACVEVLSHEKRAKVAVLDLAAPTYAPAPAGAPEILYFKVDVTDAAAVKQVADQIRKRYGDPSILINCAGIASGSTIFDTDLKNLEKVWRVNTLSNYVTAQEFVPHIVKQNHGHILTVASSASYMCLPQMGEYATSKSAALAFHEVLHGELNARYGAPKVRASICTPTKVRTSLGDGMEDHNMPFLTPNLMPIQVGRAMVNAIDSGLSHYIIMPQFMRILPWMRSVPDWVKRIVQILGHTDTTVTNKSVGRALNNGYGSDWTDELKASREKVLKGLVGK